MRLKDTGVFEMFQEKFLSVKLAPSSGLKGHYTL